MGDKTKGVTINPFKFITIWDADNTTLFTNNATKTQALRKKVKREGGMMLGFVSMSRRQS